MNVLFLLMGMFSKQQECSFAILSCARSEIFQESGSIRSTENPLTDQRVSDNAFEKQTFCRNQRRKRIIKKKIHKQKIFSEKI